MIEILQEYQAKSCSWWGHLGKSWWSSQLSSRRIFWPQLRTRYIWFSLPFPLHQSGLYLLQKADWSGMVEWPRRRFGAIYVSWCCSRRWYRSPASCWTDSSRSFQSHCWVLSLRLARLASASRTAKKLTQSWSFSLVCVDQEHQILELNINWVGSSSFGGCLWQNWNQCFGCQGSARLRSRCRWFHQFFWPQIRRSCQILKDHLCSGYLLLLLILIWSFFPKLFLRSFLISLCQDSFWKWIWEWRSLLNQASILAFQEWTGCSSKRIRLWFHDYIAYCFPDIECWTWAWMARSWSSWYTHPLPRRSDFQKKCLVRAVLCRVGSSSPMIWVCRWSRAEYTSIQRTSAQEWQLLCKASWAVFSGSIGHHCSKWHFVLDLTFGHLGLRAWPNGLRSAWGKQSTLYFWGPQLLAYFSWMRSEAYQAKIQLQ